MNALLLMSSALFVGADAPAAAAVPVAPVIMAAPVLGGCGGAGCGDCGVGSPCGCSDPNPMAKTGLFGRIRSHFAKPEPVFTGFTTAACCDSGTTDAGRTGLLAKLKAKFHGSDSASVSSGCCGTPSCATGGCATGGCATGGCALPPVPGTVTPAAPAEAPKAMPKAGEAPKADEKPKTDAPKTAPKTDAPKISAPSAPILSPVGAPSAPILGGSTTPY